VDPEKNVGMVITAFKRVCEKMDNVQLVIVGDGVDKAKLEKQASSKIHFLGRIVPPELYTVYKLGDVFATASEIETQGIVLIEAAASGLPLVAVDAGAVSEICRDGENGVLCEPGNVAEIAAALELILGSTELRKKFAKNSVEFAHEHDFEKTLDQYINIYNRVISNRSL
jgi:glycosyltransferase involved in cell wall biosynthesis